MNNVINEVKNTLERTNSRITEAENRIREVEDRMVEINEAERKKEKRIKRNEDNLRDLCDNVKCPSIWIIGVPEEEDEKKGHEKILEEIIVEILPKMGKEIVIQVQETQSPKQGKPKAKHPKTHINQINNDQTQRTNIKNSKGKTTNNTQGDSHMITADLSIETLQVRREWQDVLKVMKEKTYNLDYCTQQGSHSNMKEKSKALQTSKSWENSAPPNQLFNKC